MAGKIKRFEVYVFVFRFFLSEKDYRNMFKTLDKMHAMLDKPPESLKEVSFLQMYGRDLKEAQRWCELYKVG